MRTISAAVRQGLETADSVDALLAFLTITHVNLADPIRVVSDVLDYQIGGVTWLGVPFNYRLLSDGDGTARTQIVMEAVDRRISQALRSATERAKITLELRSSADFDLTVIPRIEAVSNPPVYAFAGFELINVTGDALQISGDIELADYTVEPWPYHRGTQDLLPGLYR